ncbi:uncharacterized protein LOC120190537 [Hibiscus syriacus]|uniref:uncharacterized protein LOC120190537 n=1 Tax=Hibiscus syriacus TaxID=106335 RepID=UPI001923AAB8|nr:uncharacterized protein LOC120190537 [Hibiscus syriacus]
MAEKEGGIVKKGHEEGMKMAIGLLEEFGLPMGLLPLVDVVHVGFVRSTGYMWIVQKKKVEHNFKMISKLVSYDTEITGYVEQKRIKKLKGVKAKEFMLWPPVNEIILDDPPTGKIHFKSLAGVTKTFPVDALLPASKMHCFLLWEPPDYTNPALPCSCYGPAENSIKESYCDGICMILMDNLIQILEAFSGPIN